MHIGEKMTKLATDFTFASTIQIWQNGIAICNGFDNCNNNAHMSKDALNWQQISQLYQLC
jgi:hypothetical protein